MSRPAKYRKIELPPKNNPFRDQKAGYVYIVKFGDRFKIGMTSSPASRLQKIQTDLGQNFDDLHLIATSDMRTTEYFLHLRFKEQNIKEEGIGKEWFWLTDSQFKALRTIDRCYSSKIFFESDSGDIFSKKIDPEDYIDIEDEVRCRAMTSNNRRCAKRIYKDGIYCYVHRQVSGK